MNRSDIGEGYTLVNNVGLEYVVVNYKNKRHLVNPAYISDASIDYMMDSELNAINGHRQIVAIKDKSDNIIWEMPRELTMQEIANKFGIPVEQLRIKK
jgi:hypothetical protein